MGQRGPSRTPTALLQARGSRRAAQRTNEPVPPEGEIKPPHKLNELEQEVWDQAVPILSAMGVLTTADVYLLAVWVFEYTEWLIHREIVQRDGAVDVFYEPDSEFDPAETASIDELGLSEKIVRQLAAFNCRKISDLDRAIDDDLLTQIKGIGKKTAEQIVELFHKWREVNPVSKKIKYKQVSTSHTITKQRAAAVQKLGSVFGMGPSFRVGLQVSEEHLRGMVDKRKKGIDDLIQGNRDN